MSDIRLKGIIDEDFVNYKVPSMSLMFPICSFKCGKQNCQNTELYKSKDILIDTDALCQRYLNNPITEAVVCQGLEPLDSLNDLFHFIKTLRNKYKCDDDIVIYTGYDEDEVTQEIDILKKFFANIIIKFGRYIPNDETHFDDILGVKLASNNQYAKKIS